MSMYTHKKILVNQNGLLIVCVTFALWLKNLEKFTTRMARLFELESELTCKVFTSLSITNTIHIVLFTDQYGIGFLRLLVTTQHIQYSKSFRVG